MGLNTTWIEVESEYDLQQFLENGYNVINYTELLNLSFPGGMFKNILFSTILFSWREIHLKQDLWQVHYFYLLVLLFHIVFFTFVRICCKPHVRFTRSARWERGRMVQSEFCWDWSVRRRLRSWSHWQNKLTVFTH